MNHRAKIAGALALLLVCLGVVPAAAQAEPLRIESATGFLQTSAGAPLFSAGAHPELNVTFHFNKVTSSEPSHQQVVAANPKDIEATLPAGLIADPMAAPKCEPAAFTRYQDKVDCEPDTQIGVVSITVYNRGRGVTLKTALFNVEPPPGVAAEFTFQVLGAVISLNSSVTPDGEYRIRSAGNNVPQAVALGDTSVTIWGVPASSVHDGERVVRGGFISSGEVGAPGGEPKLAFVSNPTRCSGSPLVTETRADSWEEPGSFSEKSYDTDVEGNPMTITECGNVPFEASLKAQPTTAAADSPTGLEVNLQLAQNELPEGIADSTLREAVLTLPAGMAVTPSSAAGLGACSEAQIGLGNGNQPSCPESSRLGTVEVVTPVLADPLPGTLYLAQQHQNKFGSLLALYLVIDDPVSGVLVKLPGKVETDPTSGRLVVRFPELPQLPVRSLKVKLFGGQGAALVSPPTCGTYTTEGEFVPWSGNAPVVSTDSFKVTSGPEGSACPNGNFTPTLRAGVANATAGKSSPFELQVTRVDGEPRLASVSAQLPEGLLARLAGIPYCSDQTLAGIPSAEGTGAAQLASPSCPAASKVGTVAVGAGAGLSPLNVNTGSAYLAGPYKGAPLSLALVVPAVAGPFDLGNVVVRAALGVNPETTRVTAVSDPIPSILDGIPLDLRQVQVDLDRPEFVVNPTSCGPQRITATVTSTTGVSAAPSVPFAVSSCRNLGFAPQLSVRLSGATGRTGNPALRAELKAPEGQSNLASAQVVLPKSEFIDQAHVADSCTRVQFAASQCPESSVLGTAKAWSPLLAQPLEGPVYFRSNGGERKLPDIVADLHGQIDVVLVGFIDSAHKKGTEGSRVRTTFASIPDAPVSKFVLDLRGGKRGLLENSVDLCQGSQKAGISFVGQNGRRRASSQVLRVKGCGKGPGG